MSNSNTDIVNRLSRYRPVGPSEVLRERVLAASNLSAAEGRARRRHDWMFRAAVAAGLLLAIGLGVAADRSACAVAAQTGRGAVVWTEDAEQLACALDGAGWVRRYIAAVMAVEPDRPMEVEERGGLP